MQCSTPNPVRVSDVQKLLRSDRLHHQAEAALRQRLAEEPRDAGALLRIGGLDRRRMDLAMVVHEVAPVPSPAGRAALRLRGSPWS